MDINKVLQHFVMWNRSLPAIKLAWNCELDLQECDFVPKISPSHYKSEILLTTNERYSLLCRQQKKFELHKSGFEIIAVPSILVFQNYRVGHKYTTKLNLRNISKLSQKATFFMDESNGFTFEEGSARVAKFAPGMTIAISVNFVPQDNTDYYHKIVISTKTSRFAVPIVGIGSRGIIDLPDVFDFEKVPVKVLKKKFAMAYNTGTETARFSLTTDGFFSVRPERGVVAAKDSFPFEISFIADYKQDYEGYILIKYDNDEEVHCVCKAKAIDADICVSPREIAFEDTYISLKSKATMVIFNNSDDVIDFKWVKYLAGSADSGKEPTIEVGAGDSFGGNFRTFIMGSGGGESRRHLNLEVLNQTSEIGNAFFHETFTVEPLLGKIQPRSSIDILAIFSPITHFKYDVDAYLSITGLQDPIVVPISGYGLGPEFKFAFQELDIGTIFMGGSHAYELPVVNTSQIEGTIKFDKVLTSGKDALIHLEPERITLAPDQYGAFYLHMIVGGGKLGDFSEQIRFSSARSSHHHVITIRGKTVFPRMHFSLSEILFGDVGLGFPKSKQVLLINDSLNTVAIVLGITADGTDEPMDFNKLIEIHSKKRSAEAEPVEESNPREFTIEPKFFSLQPKGFQRITVTICAKKVREIHGELALCIAPEHGSLSPPTLQLPLRAVCKTPTIRNAEPELCIRDAFLHFSNTGEFRLKNPSDVSAVYCIIPVASRSIRSEWHKLVGVAKAKSITNVPFTFTANSPGDSSADYDLYVLGNDEKLETMTVKITASAAKLTVSSRKVDFGKVDLLTPTLQSLDIINDSPLTIPFTIQMLDGGQNGDLWQFEPESGVMEAESKTPIQLTLTLREIGIHNALLIVQMQEAANHIDIKLTSLGVGTGLVFSPEWRNPAQLDFGNMFTKTTNIYAVEVTNMAHTTKMLEWVNSKDPPPEDPNPPRRINHIPEGKTKKPKVVHRKENSIFTIFPTKKTLPPLGTTTFTFTTSSMIHQVVEEVYKLWTYTPKQGAVETQRPYEKSVPRRSRIDVNAGFRPYQEVYKPVVSQILTLKASFETPKLTFSRRAMLFQIDAFPSQTDFLQEDMLKIENKGTLPITAVFETRFPFSMKMKHHGVEDDITEWTHVFEAGAQILLTIIFDGQHLRKDRGSYVFDTDLSVLYEGHPETEKIPLKGEVNFPQVQTDRDVFDIGVISNGTEAVEEFSVTNPCNFCLTYKWYIKPRSTQIEYEPGEMDKHCFELECESNVRTHAKSRDRKRQRKRDKKKANKKSAGINHGLVVGARRGSSDPSHSSKARHRSKPSLGGPVKSSSVFKHSLKRSSLSNDSKLVQGKHEKSDHKKVPKAVDPSKELDRYGDWVQFVRNKYFRTRMMETIGLHDHTNEREDEINYLTYNRTEPKTINNFAISQLIDIVPLAGIIQAGQTQNFVLVFYGHSNVKLKTTAICYIEGGTSKSIEITAQSTYFEETESPPTTVPSEHPSNENASIIVKPKSEDSKSEAEDIDSSNNEFVDNFKHRCQMRPHYRSGKKKANKISPNK